MINKIKKTIKRFKCALRANKISLILAALLFLSFAKISFAAEKFINTSLWDLFSLHGLMKIFLNIAYIVIYGILGSILTLAGTIFDWSLKLSTQYDQGTLQLITAGWEVSLKFANMFFILIFLAIGIGTILQSGTINKKLIPQFVMVILLINFSLVIGNVIIDTANIPAVFLNNVIQQTGNVSDLLMNAMKLNFTKEVDNGTLMNSVGDSLKNMVDLIIILILFAFFNLSAIFVLLAGSVYMLARTFNLWFLLMLAPLAWIAYLLPGLQQHWKKWWSEFFKWSFFAPAFLFFTYLSLLIMGKSASMFASLTANNTSSYLPDVLQAGTIIQLLIISSFMLLGLKVSSAFGITTSNFVINWGQKQVGGFKGALGKLRSETKVGKFVSELGQRGGELTARGIAAVPGAGRLAGYEKEVVSARIKKEREKEREKEIAQEAEKLENRGTWELHGMIDDIKKGTGTSSIQKAAAVKILMSRGEEATAGLSEIELGYMRQAEAAAKSTLDRKDNISVPYAISFKARKEEVDKNLKNIESAGSKYEKEDINRLYSIYQGALHTGRTSPRTASILTALENRIDEIMPIILPGATPQQINAEKSKMKSNIKSAKNAASKGKTRTTYLP